jgi:hypothetical protein
MLVDVSFVAPQVHRIVNVALHRDFLVTHLPVFADVTDPLEMDSWLCITESKFGLLHCIEYQKILYATQQLRGTAGAW